VLSAWPGRGAFRSAYLAGGSDGFGQMAVGDHGQVVYRFWLLGHGLNHGEPPWRDPYSFQPLVEPQLALGGWPFGIPFWPLEAAFGPIVAWNVLLLATVVLAGLLTDAWLRSLGLGRVAAAIGGLAFAIAPYRLAQSSDHLLGWVAVVLPLALLAIERSRAARTRRAAHGWGAVAALAVLTFPLSGQLHLALGAIPLCLGYATVRFRPVPFWWTIAAALTTTGIGLALRFTVIAGSELGERRSLEAVSTYSAEPIDFLDRWHASPNEELVYLGWLTPALAIAGLVVLARGRRRGLALLLGLATLVPILLAFGTNLPLYGPLRSILPPLENVRVPGRLLPVADLALAALAAIAAGWILARAGARRAAAAGATLVVLVLADLTIMPFAPTPGDPANDAYAALGDRAPGRILELPIFGPGRNEGAAYNLYTLQAPRERPSGYSTLAPAPTFDFYFRLGRLACGAWLPGDEEELERLGVNAVLFHEGLYRRGVPGAWFAWRSLLDHGWRPVARGGAVSLLEQRPRPRTPGGLSEPARNAPYLCRGWSRVRRTIERQAPLWVWGSGQLTMEFSSARPTVAVLWMEGRRQPSFTIEGRGTVRVRLKGRRWHPLMVEILTPLEAGGRSGLRLARISFPSR
jgi:hypothetical protein